jgi:hypothetical protein
MIKINNIDDVIFWWIEELPISEISSEKAQKIIENYRLGHINVLNALEDLEMECSEDIEEYLKTNKELKKLFKK